MTVKSKVSPHTAALGALATQNGTFAGTSSGTNTGDQTITLTGDVTGSGTGSFATVFIGVNAAPAASITLPANYSLVVSTQYVLAANVGLTLAAGAIMRIL